MAYSKVLDIARGEIGYSRFNDPERGSKYGRWYAKKTGNAYYGANNVPYCAMFVSWVLAQAEQTVAGFPSAYCPDILTAGQKNGLVLKNKKNAQPGDIVLFDWDGGLVDHVGIVEKNNGTNITTIEGNTSNGYAGSQSNGGLVARRTRQWGQVRAVIRPKYTTTKKGIKKMFTFQANEQGGIYFYDGEVHPLHHKDELEALKMAFKKAGYDLPHIGIGTQKEPWGTRLLDALTRQNDHKLTLK